MTSHASLEPSSTSQTQNTIEMGGDDDEGKREAGDDLMKHPPTICGGGCVEKIEKNTGAAGPSKKKKKKEVIHRGLSDQRPPSWSDEELAALRKGVDHYGLDFERIRKEREVLFVNRSVHALEVRRCEDVTGRTDYH